MQLKCLKHIHITDLVTCHSTYSFVQSSHIKCDYVLDQKQIKRAIIKLCGPWLDAATHWISSGYTRFDTIKKRLALSNQY